MTNFQVQMFGQGVIEKAEVKTAADVRKVMGQWMQTGDRLVKHINDKGLTVYTIDCGDEGDPSDVMGVLKPGTVLA